jgi:hypothetical protein
MYDPASMKRLQILIDEELDEALEREARRTGASKASLIRDYVRERLATPPPLESDPLLQAVGQDDYDPVPIDEVVYR